MPSTSHILWMDNWANCILTEQTPLLSFSPNLPRASQGGIGWDCTAMNVVLWHRGVNVWEQRGKRATMRLQALSTLSKPLARSFPLSLSRGSRHQHRLRKKTPRTFESGSAARHLSSSKSKVCHHNRDVTLNTKPLRVQYLTVSLSVLSSTKLQHLQKKGEE